MNSFTFKLVSLFLCCTIGAAVPGYGQQTITPPSPEAAAMIRSINIPVGHYTGTVDVNIPLYTIKTRDFEIPIQLQYHTTGIKVQDCATWVGLGWRLTAGGSVVHIIRGNSRDDAEFGYANWGTVVNNASWALNEFNRISSYDCEPDNCFFEYPGNSGQFTTNSQNKIFTIPYQNIDIQLTQDAPLSSQYYKITDGSGNQYIYEAYEQIDQTQGATQTWYLTKMRSQQGEEVTFTYESGTPYSYYSEYDYHRIMRAYLDAKGEVQTSVEQEINKNIQSTIENPIYLKSINWNTGKVEFVSDEQRPEGNFGRKLNEIKIYNNDYGYIKSVYLSYGQFSNRALQLCKVEEGNTQTNDRELVCWFSYNTDQNLPERSSMDFDHWGYYNGPNSHHGHTFPSYTVKLKKIDGADRSPFWPYTSANILTSIHYKNGGKQEFKYEPNDRLSGTITNQYNQIWGGVRIKQIKLYENASSSPVITRYEYTNEAGLSSGTTYSNTMAYTSIDTNHPLRNLPFLFRLTCRSMTNICDLNGAAVGYQQVKEIQPNGSYSIYHYTSFTDHNDTPATKGTPGDTGLVNTGSNNNDGINSFRTSSAYQRGLLLKQEAFAADGTLLSRQLFHYKQDSAIRDSVKGFAIDSSEYNIFDGNSDKEVSTYELISQPVLLDSIITEKTAYNLYSLTQYEYDSATLVLRKKIEEGPDAIKYTVKYLYPQDLSSINGTSESARALLAMPNRHIYESPIEILHYKGDSLVQGEIRTYKLLIHNSADSAILPADIRILQLSQPIDKASYQDIDYSNDLTCDPRYEIKTIYANYDSKNNMINSRDNYGTSTSYIYGYNQSLPIAVVQNAIAEQTDQTTLLSGEIYHTSFEDTDGPNIRTISTAKTGQKAYYGPYTLQLSGTHRITYWESTTGTIWDKIETIASGAITIGASGKYIDEIRICPQDAQMTTYTYLPGIGITSQTDVNGNTTYYEYDSLGRLVTIKDNERHLLKKYEY